MTCIVGLLDRENIYIGGDSAAINDYGLSIRKDKKIFVKGDFIFGFAGSYRMGQLLKYSFIPPEHDKNMDTYEYMVLNFIETLRECLSKGGLTAIKNNEEEIGGIFLVGYKQRLFCVQSDFQVSERVDSFDAIGVGDQVALGSLYSTNGMHPEERILQALKASENFNSGVRGPFDIIKLEK